MRSTLSACLLVALAVIGSHAQVSQRYELVKLGPEVNTPYHEAAPVISPDGKDLYFFVQNHPENTYGKDNSQDIWVTHKDEKGWTQAKRVGAPLNKNRMNQVFNVLPDGSLFIRGGRGKDEVGFSLVSTAGRETELNIQDFKDMVKGRFYGATISSDKKQMILYFSESPQAIKSDLYVSHALEGDKWSRPVKLNITDGNDEYGPFLSPDNKVLYYASDRADANKVGGSDIYKAERTDETWNKWTKPVNLKKPINTVGGDAYFTVDSEGHVYTCRANARIDGGNFDIYVLVPKNVKINLAGTVYNMKTKAIMPSTDVKVEIKNVSPLALKAGTNGKYQSVIPETDSYVVSASAPGFLPYTETYSVPVVNNDTTLVADIYLTPVAKQIVLAGTVYDSKTSKPVESRVEVVSRADKRALGKVDAAAGKFKHDIPRLGLYVLTASAEGYLNATDSIMIDDDNVTPVTKDLYMQFIEVGLTVQLKNVYFDYNKTTLKSESFTELDKVYDFLSSNPRVEVEIAGHTDSQGSDQYNATLSQGRCQSVVDYLASKGIERSRLTPHGYGESKPIDTNDTKEGQANNRRVEFTVLKN
jgi:OOP family OmpA-OmpF porin